MIPLGIRGVAVSLMAISLAFVVPAQAAAADAAGDFLRAMAGNFRGKGSAKLFGRTDPESIACKLVATFDPGEKALRISGDCASTQGKSAVKGKLSYSGNSVTGSLIGEVDGATITKSVGTVKGGLLVVTTNFVDNATGNLTRTRQVIQLSDSGFIAQFFTYNNANARFEPAGDLAFSQS